MTPEELNERKRKNYAKKKKERELSLARQAASNCRWHPKESDAVDGSVAAESPVNNAAFDDRFYHPLMLKSYCSYVIVPCQFIYIITICSDSE